jgi:phage terminase small subunit
MFSRNQEKFLKALMLGKSIVASAKIAGVAERTARYWLEDPVFAAERKRREDEIFKQEQEDIQRILTSGYALMHKRVEALDKLSKKLEGYLEDETKIWMADVKAVGLERVDLLTFNADLFKEYRSTFADLASELGQRVKKQEINASVDVTGAKDRLFGKLSGFAKSDEQPKPE